MKNYDDCKNNFQRQLKDENDFKEMFKNIRECCQCSNEADYRCTDDDELYCHDCAVSKFND